MVYKQSKHPAEALTFLKWWSAHELPMPTRKSFLDSAFFKNNADVQFTVANYLPVAKPMSASVGGTFPQLNAIDGDGFLASLIQQLWQDVKPANAVAPAQALLVELMAK